jgi:multiple sugar transport system substrate-binding protein
MFVSHRRPLTGLVTLALASAALAACSSGPSGPGSSGGSTAAACQPAPEGTKVVLKDSWWSPGFDQVVALWNQSHPDIQVQYSNVPNGTSGTYTNYLNGIKAGKSDDLLSIEYEMLPTFRAAGGLRNISPCAGVAEAQQKFSKSVQSLTSFGEPNAVYGMAVDTAPTGLYYRKDLFQAAGLAVPTTWDEFYQDATAIKARGGYIADLSAAAPNWWPGMVIQAGGSWFTQQPDGWTVDFASAGSQKVADYWQQFLDKNLVLTDAFGSDAWNKALASDQIWTVVGATWTSGSISTGAPDTSGKWALAPLPTFSAGQPAAGTWGGVTFAVSTTSAHPYEAAQFATWVATDPQALALDVKAGLFPPSTDAVGAVPSLSEPNAFFGGEPILKTFGSDLAPTVPAGWQWGPTMVETYNSLQSEVGKALAGQQTLTEAFAHAQAATVSAMKDQSIPVTAK